MEKANKLGCLNPFAGERWADQLFSIPMPKIEPPSQLCCITILPLVGVIDLNIMRTAEELNRQFLMTCAKVQQKCRNVAAGKFGFLLGLEASIILVNGRNRLLAIHVHGLAWGELPLVKAVLKKLPRTVAGARGGKAKVCENRQRWLRYISKDARLKSIRNQDSDRKWLRTFSQHLTKDDQLTLIEAFGDLRKPEMFFASGEGVKVLSAARRKAAANGCAEFAGNRWKES